MVLLNLVLLSIACCVAINLYCVKPDYSNNVSNCSHQHCQSLSYFYNQQLQSYSELHFLPGKFILSNDIVIANAHNISLIGSKDVNSVPNTIIQCNSSFSVIMINITGLTLRNIVIKNYGPHKAEIPNIVWLKWRIVEVQKCAMIIENCSHMKVQDLIIITNNDNQGFLAINVMGYIFMNNISVNGLMLLYNETKITETILFEINNYNCIGEVVKYKLTLLSAGKNVFVKIKVTNSVFKLHQNLIFFGMGNYDYDCLELDNCESRYEMHIELCQLNYNHINSLISTIKSPLKLIVQPRTKISISDCLFLNNNMSTNYLINNFYRLESLNLCDSPQGRIQGRVIGVK